MSLIQMTIDVALLAILELNFRPSDRLEPSWR